MDANKNREGIRLRKAYGATGREEKIFNRRFTQIKITEDHKDGDFLQKETKATKVSLRCAPSPDFAVTNHVPPLCPFA
jgi:hypothetical protein